MDTVRRAPMILIEEIQHHESELLYDLLKAIEELEELEPTDDD
jgi:hypothetical protein